MKLRKLIAAASAATVAASALAVVSSAAVLTIKSKGGETPPNNIYWTPVDESVKYEKITAINVAVTAATNGNFSVGAKDSSDKWTQKDANFTAGTTTVTLEIEGVGPSDDGMVMVGVWWMNDASEMTIDYVEYVDKKGKVLAKYDSVAAEKPAETEPAETEPAETEPVETEPVETEPVEEPVETEPTEEPVDEPTEEPVDEPEVDWDAYDLDAAVAANEAFKFGEDQTIDLYAVLGDDLYDLNKVEATFTWDAGTAWCGGAGLGGGIVLDNGATWTAGPEYGAANANEIYVNDGVVTQTIIDLGDASIDQIATVGDDGVTSFGALFVQNWWNGVEANAQLASLTFYNADGDVIGELVYSEVEAPAEKPAEDSNTTPADDKGNPDTGVEGVAVVAALAAVAGAAFVISRKRK